MMHNHVSGIATAWFQNLVQHGVQEAETCCKQDETNV